MHPSKRQSAVQHTLFALLLSLIAWASGLHAELAVSLSAPANNSRYSAPATIPLQAEISVSGSSSVSQVAFYQGNTLIGSTTSSPYQWTWDNVAAGNYRLTAQATDADGSIVSSGAINLQVGLPGTQVFYIHSDHLNTPRLVTDEQNTVVWRNLPLGEPFGLSPPEEDPDGNGVPFVLNLRFPGQYYDKETNLHYNYYRDYDAATGRYVQSDPIGLRGGINTYSYVGGNPVSRIEPTGQFFFLPIIAAIAEGGAGAWGVAGLGLLGSGWWFLNQDLDPALPPYEEDDGDYGQVCEAAEHTKNKQPKNWNKHTKPRPGRDSEKKRNQPGWIPNPNQKK